MQWHQLNPDSAHHLGRRPFRNQPTRSRRSRIPTPEPRRQDDAQLRNDPLHRGAALTSSIFSASRWSSSSHPRRGMIDDDPGSGFDTWHMAHGPALFGASALALPCALARSAGSAWPGLAWQGWMDGKEEVGNQPLTHPCWMAVPCFLLSFFFCLFGRIGTTTN